LQELPESFVLKASQGCQTNLFWSNKKSLDQEEMESLVLAWKSKQFFYDKMMSRIGGVPVKNLRKYYICEKFLSQKGEKFPIDYKIYCFNGKPKAILVIGGRFSEKAGVFMTTEWTYLSALNNNYSTPDKMFDKPISLSKMIEISKKLSGPFPFVRIDLYEIDGEPIFGEMTFFPNGCINMQETNVDGISMGDLLDISEDMRAASSRGKLDDK